MHKDNSNHDELWDERAQRRYSHKGHKLYTITPIPFYLKRRKTMLSLISDKLMTARSILDFGCGDGWYIHHFNKTIHKNANIKGLDISRKMVSQAKELNPHNEIYVSSTGVNPGEKHDLVYSFATFAHIDDEILLETAKGISSALHKNGLFILFEQVAPHSYSGDNFHRRTIQEYIKIGRNAGFEVDAHTLLDFKFHRFFERHVAKRYYNFCRGKTDYEKRLAANSHAIFRSLSAIFIMFDRRPIKESAESGWGNIVIIFKKV